MTEFEKQVMAELEVLNSKFQTKEELRKALKNTSFMLVEDLASQK